MCLEGHGKAAEIVHAIRHPLGKEFHGTVQVAEIEAGEVGPLALGKTKQEEGTEDQNNTELCETKRNQKRT